MFKLVFKERINVIETIKDVYEKNCISVKFYLRYDRKRMVKIILILTHE